jgi:hypothetical protein
VLNALVANEEMRGHRGHRVPALPRRRVTDTLRATLTNRRGELHSG